MSARNTVTPTRDISPSEMAHQLVKLIQDFEALKNHQENHAEGCMITTPTTGSTQAGGVGNTDWNVDLDAGLVVVNGVALHVDRQADYDVHSGSLYDVGFAVGDSAIATIIAQNLAGTVTIAVVKGASAVTGSQVAPSDAEIQAAVGAAGWWIRLADCTLNRTGNIVVTQSQDNTVRPIPAINVDTLLGDWSAYV